MIRSIPSWLARVNAHEISVRISVAFVQAGIGYKAKYSSPRRIMSAGKLTMPRPGSRTELDRQSGGLCRSGGLSPLLPVAKAVRLVCFCYAPIHIAALPRDRDGPLSWLGICRIPGRPKPRQETRGELNSASRSLTIRRLEPRGGICRFRNRSPARRPPMISMWLPPGIDAEYPTDVRPRLAAHRSHAFARGCWPT